MAQKDRDALDFAIFLLYRLAKAWNMSVPDVFHLLDKSNIFEGYILRCYDTLHTQGADYLVDDVTDLARSRGVLA